MFISRLTPGYSVQQQKSSTLTMLTEVLNAEFLVPSTLVMSDEERERRTGSEHATHTTVVSQRVNNHKIQCTTEMLSADNGQLQCATESLCANNQQIQNTGSL